MKCLQNRHTETFANLARPFGTLGAIMAVIFMTFAVVPPLAHSQQRYELTLMDPDLPVGGWPLEWEALHVEGQEPVRILPRDINDNGIAVGTAVNLEPHFERAFMYVHPVRRMIDLNLLDATATWTDLDTGNDVGNDDWYAKRGYGINIDNQIVGMARKYLSDGNLVSRFFVHTDPLGAAPKFELLPTCGTIAGGGAGYRPPGCSQSACQRLVQFTLIQFTPRRFVLH